MTDNILWSKFLIRSLSGKCSTWVEHVLSSRLLSHWKISSGKAFFYSLSFLIFPRFLRSRYVLVWQNWHYWDVVIIVGNIVDVCGARKWQRLDDKNIYGWRDYVDMKAGKKRKKRRSLESVEVAAAIIEFQLILCKLKHIQFTFTKNDIKNCWVSA